MSSGRRIVLAKPPALHAERIEHTASYFVHTPVPDEERARSVYLCALIELVEAWTARACSGHALDTVEHALCIEKQLCRYALRRRDTLDEQHRVLVWMARCRLTHLCENMHVVEPVTRLKYGMAWSGTIAEVAVTIDRDDTRLTDWFEQHRMLPLRAQKQLDLYGALALWKTLLLFIERWPLFDYGVWPEVAVRRLRCAVAAFIGRAGDRRQFNHVSMCKQVDGAEAGVYMMTHSFVVETERIFHFLERDLACCSSFVWTEAPYGGRFECMSEGDAVLDKFASWVSDLVKGTHREFIEEDFRTLVYDFYVQPAELDRFIQYNPFDKKDAQVCISRLRQTDFDALRIRLCEPPVDKAWQTCAQGTGPEYMLLASLAIDYAFQAMFDGIEFKESYLHTPQSLEPYTKGAAVAHRRSAAELFKKRDVNTGTLRYYYRLRYEHGMRESKSAYSQASHAHPVIVRTMNGSHVSLPDGSLLRCGHFGIAFCEWLRLLCEDKRVCGRLANTSSVLALYERLMPARAALFVDELEATNTRVELAERPVFDESVQQLASVGAKRALQYA